MKKTAYTLPSIAAFCLFALSASAADITYSSTDTGFSSQPNGIPDGSYTIYLTGSIEQQDLQAFKSTLHTLAQQVNAAQGSPLDRKLILSSAGGNVATALSIGRLIRATQMHVVVPDSAKCLSSCVFLLAAGVIKYPWGDIGIHRPYFLSPPNQSYDSALKSILSESKKYFQEMNIPESLADEMFSIPPADMRLLGDIPLSRYRLNQDDMAYAEQRANKNAKAYGLSRQEYERRTQLSDRLAKECRAQHVYINKNDQSEATSLVVRCHDLADKKAGLILKNN